MIDTDEIPPPSDDDAPPPTRLGIVPPNDQAQSTIIRGLTKGLASAVDILSNPGLRELLLGPGELELNEMTQAPEFGRRQVNEALQLQFRNQVARRIMGQRGKGDQTEEYRVEFSPETTADAFKLVCSEHSYHPVREYLSSLPRTPMAAIAAVAKLLGQQGIGATLLRKWAIGCVARAYQPGCQVDTVLILVSEKQGQGKSSFFRSIAGDAWFSDSPMDISNKDSLMQLSDAWIYEWGELSSMRRPDWETIKGFTTSRVDAYRAPYARTVTRNPRTAVIVGTTNRTDFLGDASGNRRWWPIKVGKIDQEWVRKLREDFWAEAREAYLAEEPWWFDEDTTEAQAIGELHQAVEHHDEWESILSKHLAEIAEVVTVGKCLTHIGVDAADQDKAKQMRCADVLRKLGWTRTRRVMDNGKRVFPWGRCAM
jgi:predicted P-loop ATPase